MSQPLHKAAELSELTDDMARRVVIEGNNIMLVRDGNEVRAYGADCPHAGGPLEQGALCNGRIVCPWHKATFDVRDGSLIEPPALMPLPRYAVSVVDGAVMVGTQPLPVADSASPGETQPLPGGGVSSFAGVAPPADTRTFVIVGGGAAGAAACAALREYGFTGRIALVRREAQAPYDRTALSKFVPSGEMAAADVPPLLPNDFYPRNHIDLLTTEVARLDAAARRIDCIDGTSLDYDAALVASGGAPRTLDLPGAALRHILTLRSVDDAARIVDTLHDGARVVVLGSSFIGLEVASSLRKRGIDVTVVSPETVPLEKQFGTQIGRMFRRLHEVNGVRFHMDQQAAAFAGTEADGDHASEEGHHGGVGAAGERGNADHGGSGLTAERLGANRRDSGDDGSSGAAVREVILDNGERLPADLVIVGTGVTPATTFITGVKLNDDGGIPVDAGMRAAGALYAAGDIAVFPLPRGAPARIEHWRVAQQHARIAARNMLGGNESYSGVPFFWTYHYGKRFEYLGHARDWDDILIDGELERQDFLALFVKDQRVMAVAACGREAATARLAEAMRESLPPDEAWRIAGADMTRPGRPTP